MEATLAQTQESPVEQPSMFPEVAQIRDCSFIDCPNGHQWQPTLALVKCGNGTPQGWNGCGKPILGIKMELCPICHEPSRRLVLRVDHTPPAPYPIPMCIPGSATLAEVQMVEVRFRSSANAEQGNIFTATERIEQNNEVKEQNG